MQRHGTLHSARASPCSGAVTRPSVEGLGAQIQRGQLGLEHVGHRIVRALFNKVFKIVGGKARAVELLVDEAAIRVSSGSPGFIRSSSSLQRSASVIGLPAAGHPC